MFRSCVAVVVCLAVLRPLPAAAQTFAPSPGLVIRGTISAAEARWDETRTLFTYVTVDVRDVVVGTRVPRRLVLKQLGGEVGGIGLRISGQAAFAAGEDVLLDLAVRADGTLQTRGLARGKWSIVPDATSGAATAVQMDADGRDVSESLPALATRLTRAYVPLADVAPSPREYSSGRASPGPLFTYLPTTSGFPARWHEVDDRAAVFVDAGPIPGSWTHASGAQVTSAINVWRGSGMELDLRQGGSAGGGCPASFTGNGRITVAFNDPCGVTEWVIGGGYYTLGDLRTVGGTTFQKFVQGFVVLDDSGPQATQTGCFQDAITHGLGHALGLGHTTSAGAIMAAGPPSSCPAGGSGLGADDIAGITGIYRGIPSATAPPDTPSAFTATAQLSTAVFAWTPATTGGVPQRFLIDAGSAPGVYNLGTVQVNAPATTFSISAVPPGTYYVRLRAQNALGTSAPTGERSLTVGACAAPGAPASLTGTANGPQVSLQWTPPATGVVQGYRLAAGTAPGAANLAVVDVPAAQTALAGSVPFGTYYVRVHATNVCGVSPPSQEVQLIAQPCSGPPTAPTGLTGSVAGRFVSLSWSAPASGPAPSSYVLYAGSAPGASNITIYSTGTIQTALGAPAPPGTYYIRAASANACGTSAVSNEVQLIVP